MPTAVENEDEVGTEEGVTLEALDQRRRQRVRKFVGLAKIEATLEDEEEKAAKAQVAKEALDPTPTAERRDPLTAATRRAAAKGMSFAVNFSDKSDSDPNKLTCVIFGGGASLCGLTLGAHLRAP